MKSSGSKSPRSGCCQRTSASQRVTLVSGSDPLGQGDDPARLRAVLHEDHELVAPEARDCVGPADGLFQPRRDGAQELVAELVALAVVYELEAVEVHEEHRDEAGAPLEPRER